MVGWMSGIRLVADYICSYLGQWKHHTADDCERSTGNFGEPTSWFP